MRLAEIAVKNKRYAIKIFNLLTPVIILLSTANLHADESDNDYILYSLALNKLFASFFLLSQNSNYYDDNRYITNIFIYDSQQKEYCKQHAKYISKYSKEMSRQMLSIKNCRRKIPLVDSFNLDFKYKIFQSLDSFPRNKLKIFSKKDTLLQQILLPAIIYNQRKNKAIVYIYSSFSYDFYEAGFGDVYLCYLKKIKNKWVIRLLTHVHPGSSQYVIFNSHRKR